MNAGPGPQISVRYFSSRSFLIRRWSRKTPTAPSVRNLLIFEAWHLGVIGVALIAFNHVSALAGSTCTALGIWIAALGTVGVTGELRVLLDEVKPGQRPL